MATPIRMVAGDADAPRDQWYVIAFAGEVGREPLARMILDDPVVLYRREDGTPVALFDRCPHRGMPLSNGGRLIDDAIQCNYHGLQFAPDGTCRAVPSGGPIAGRMCVHSYPIAEVWDWIWIWPGDAAKADPALIPDHHAFGLTDPAMHAYPALMLVNECNYLHVTENLSDATHVSYLHHGFVDTGNVAAHPFREIVAEDRVTTVREFRDETVHPYARTSYGLRCDVVDRELTLDAIAPSLTVVTERYQEKGIDDPRQLIVRLVMPVTPASHTSCYQFVAVVRTLPTDPSALVDGLRGFLMEDVVALGAIQTLFDRTDPARRAEVHVRADNPQLRMRRIIEKMIRSERAPILEAAE